MRGEIDSRLPVIIVTAYSTTETAIDAMKRGAFDYLLKPVDIHQLRELIANALEVSRLQHVPALFEEESEETTSDAIVGRSAAMQEVYKTIGRDAAPLGTRFAFPDPGSGSHARAAMAWSETLVPHWGLVKGNSL